MKKLTVILAVLIVGLSGYVIRSPTTNESENQPSLIDNQGWLNIQKQILTLFENVCEDSLNPMIIKLAQEFTLDNSDDGFDLKSIQKLQELQNKLAKGDIFSEYDQNNLIELKTYYEVLKNAKNFHSFLKFASWLRQNVNCGVFVDAVYLAVQNRKDTKNAYVPAPYEVLPNYFIHKEVILKASSLLADLESASTDDVISEGNTYTITANYTADMNSDDGDDEAKLAYFREDIGLNTYYFLDKLNEISSDSMSGEVWYHKLTQLLARYNLERYSNSLQEVETICWDCQRQCLYNPFLIYSNGNSFRAITCNKQSQSAELLAQIQRIESGVQSIANQKQAGTYMSKSELLNQLQEIFVKNNYVGYTKTLFSGNDMAPNGQKTTLDHYMTELRDPTTWNVLKKMFYLVENATNQLTSYSRNELYFPGVEVVNIDVKKFMTSMDNFEIDVTDSLKTNEKPTNYQVKVTQSRLNNKPFSIKVTVSSLAAQKGLVKIYLGPRVMPGKLSLEKHLFMLLDTFEYNLKMGSNVISRSSNDFTNLADDFISLRNLRKNLEDAEFGLTALTVRNIKTIQGFPKRLLLPKGSEVEYQIFVFVAPVFLSKTSSGTGSFAKEFNSALLSPGYPLDLNLENSDLFDFPNAKVKIVTITHKGKSDYVYDPSNKPVYGQQKQGFDLKMKQEKYGKKPSYNQYAEKTTQAPAIIEPAGASTIVIVKTTSSPVVMTTENIMDTKSNIATENPLKTDSKIAIKDKKNVSDSKFGDFDEFFDDLISGNTLESKYYDDDFDVDDIMKVYE